MRLSGDRLYREDKGTQDRTLGYANNTFRLNRS